MNELFAQLRNLWEGMDTTRRVITVAVPLIVIIFILVGVRMANTPRYELLFARLNQQDQGEIVAKLDEMRIPYRVTAAGGIEVPNAVSVRASLLTAGIPHGGVVGWEIFDKSSFSATDFTNETNRQRAIAGELTRTLQNVEGVMDARIIPNLPNSSDQYLFTEDKPQGAVSVQLQLRSPDALSETQVGAIANLVAAATGVKVENVTIIDNYANDLTAMLRNKQGSKYAANAAANTFAAKSAYETELERRTESMLYRVFGFNKAVVRVNAELNLDYQEVRSETFGDKGVPRSEQEKTETTKGSGTNNNVGAPGTDSNTPQYKSVDSGSSSYATEKEERTVNYEINKTEEFRVAAPGTIRRLTVGVWVDGNLPAATRDKITNTLSSALGISAARGDQLTVETIRFSQPKPTPSSGNAGTVPWQAIAIGLIAGVVILLGMLIFRKPAPAPAQAQTVSQPETAEGAEAVPSMGVTIDELIGSSAQAEPAAAVFELSPEEKQRRENLASVEKLAKEKPEEVAVLLKAWLSED